MFPKNAYNLLDLNFSKFAITWEQRRLGDLLKVSKERNNKNEYTKEQVLSVSREVGTVNQIEYQGRSFAGADISGYKVVHLGQMIYTKSPLKDAPYGIFQNVTVEGIVSPLYAVYNSTDKALASFIGLQLKDDNLATHYLSPLVSKGAKNTINVTDEGALGGIVFHPSIAEQQEIIDFFTALDHLITLHQRECDLLLKTKKSYLQKMFPKNGEDKPEIRFVGFNDAWEQRKLGEFGKATGGTSIESEFVDNGSHKVISIGSYSEDSKYTDQGIRVNETRKTIDRILDKDDITMILNDKTASGNIIGRVLLIDTDNTYVYNQRTQRIEVNKEEYIPMFLYHYLNADNIRSKIIKASQGNTQIYVNWSVISELQYLIPNSSEEQTQIGTFFQQLDNLITLHQRKHDKLIFLKKSMLEKMFPQKGEKIPEVRFSGFNNDWEQRKLGEIYKFQYGQFNTNPSNGGQYPVYGANGVIGGYTEFNAEDSVIIGHMGEYAGIVLWGNGKHFVTYNGIITTPRDNKVNSKFGYYLLQQKNIRQICGGSGQPFLSYEMLDKLQSIFPINIEEQKKLAKFFTELDNLITLHQGLYFIVKTLKFILGKAKGGKQ